MDIVAAFEYGQYDDDIAFNSGWAQGDWNGDRDFDAADLVFGWFRIKGPANHRKGVAFR